MNSLSISNRGNLFIYLFKKEKELYYYLLHLLYSPPTPSKQREFNTVATQVMEEPRSQTGESEVTQRLARAGNHYHPWSGVQSKGDGAQKLPRLRVPCFLLSSAP